MLGEQSAILESKELADGLKNGMVDFTMPNLTFDAKQYPAAFLGNLPMLYDNSKMGTAFAYKLVAGVPEYADAIKKCGHLISIWAPGTGAFFSVKTPVYTPADLAGKRVLVMVPSDVEPIKALGAVPVIVNPGDIYVGLQRGMGEICWTAWPMAGGLRLDEVCKYATNCAYASAVLQLCMSHMDVDNLPKDVVKVIEDSAGTALSDRISDALTADVENVKARFKAAGAEVIDLTPEQLAAFREKATQLVENYWIPFLEKNGLKNAKELVAKVYEISDANRAEFNAK